MKSEKDLPPFTKVVTDFFEDNEKRYANGDKPYEDEDLIIQISHAPQRPTKTLLALLAGKLKLHKLRNQFNRGKFQNRNRHAHPDFFSWRYDRHGRRVDGLDRPISEEKVAKLSVVYQESRRRQWGRTERFFQARRSRRASSGLSEAGTTASDAVSALQGGESSTTGDQQGQTFSS